ncbi:response regulator [Stieleria sp. TO1_6]|uniref:response regulator n=1 Tax=Stieleria tagensis TaxID=2956795 RepID=UPI00209B389D|nr:response regulator [Stieleria tagensis]MCO8124900.1 response regulator [Stieleria tagensis]
MLVLSRKENQRVVFPNLGVAVEILRVEGNRVRVGVDAPKDVRILRGELADGQEMAAADEASRKQKHDLRNRLNSANLAMHLLQKQLDAGMVEDAESTLAGALETFGELERLASGQMASGQSPQPTIKQDGQGRRALVVEDNANERELLAGYLRLCGYEVDTVQDGIDAMLYLAKHQQRPDVVLLDMQMPRMDGPNTINAIRSNPYYRDVKIFAVSGSERAAMGVEMGDQGVDRWFSKPLQPSEFADELGRECANR